MTDTNPQQEKQVSAPIIKINLWNPHKNQIPVVQSKKRWKVLVCGRRFGKTTYAVNTLIKHALLKPGGIYWYVAPTYRQGKDIAWSMLLESVKKLPKALVHKTNESELYVVIGNNSRIAIKGADNPDSLRGVGLDGVVLDEYSDFRSHVFTQIIQPALTDKKGWATFIGTPKGFNHFYDLYMMARNNEAWDAWHFTTYDNPTIDPAEIENMKYTTSSDNFAQEYMADFRKAEGIVYKEFNRDVHILPEEKIKGIQMLSYIGGVDFGYTNPAAVVIIGKDFDSRYYVVAEWYKVRQTTPEIGNAMNELNRKFPIQRWYPDPQAAAAIEELARSGFSFGDTDKDIVKGIDSVRSLFQQNRLFISENCKNLISELETYSYPNSQDFSSKVDRNEKEKPIKENDHALDALRYALFSSMPVQEVVNPEFNLYNSSYW